jgi:hypothetical protein
VEVMMKRYFCPKATNFWGIYFSSNPLLTDFSEKNFYEENFADEDSKSYVGEIVNVWKIVDICKIVLKTYQN